jgi:hypothetical protein
MKIGILTYHRTHNYGAFLQSYALANALLNNTNHEVEIIDFNMDLASKANKKEIFYNWKQTNSIWYNILKYQMFKNCQKKILPLSKKKLVTDSLKRFTKFIGDNYEAIIVGSDEVWRLDGYRGFPNPYWLPGINQCKKIAYAVSSRNEYDKLSTSIKDQVEKYLIGFDYIGTRDIASQKLLSRISHGTQPVELNCDPTFAYDFHINKEDGLRILKEDFHIDTNNKCIGLMIGVSSLANEIIKNNKEKVQFISLYYYYSGTKGFRVLTPFEWINVIAALDALVTTFFHGMVFALKTNTPFILVENRSINNPFLSKSFDVLFRHNLQENCMILEQEGTAFVLEKIWRFIEYIKYQNIVVDYSQICAVENERFLVFLTKLESLFLP